VVCPLVVTGEQNYQAGMDDHDVHHLQAAVRPSRYPAGTINPPWYNMTLTRPPIVVMTLLTQARPPQCIYESSESPGFTTYRVRKLSNEAKLRNARGVTLGQLVDAVRATIQDEDEPFAILLSRLEDTLEAKTQFQRIAEKIDFAKRKAAYLAMVAAQD
jgi:hypothetical protein